MPNTDESPEFGRRIRRRTWPVCFLVVLAVTVGLEVTSGLSRWALAAVGLAIFAVWETTVQTAVRSR
ncbi:hypothetical protein Rrhod_1596 [Rhodococcus rhodnii LMG 5362]|uniref:Uncharacterized protein n=1 Tax=Rhodococcus rhodnii LMG 5362 TaxID=1273125 RepID=R7WNU4_9NOCA|nr:hypothetical protein Rrhod_1596 [Rhodococcus rhodnii LMG 5362]